LQLWLTEAPTHSISHLTWLGHLHILPVFGRFLNGATPKSSKIGSF
jgi:hypothetical protein